MMFTRAAFGLDILTVCGRGRRRTRPHKWALSLPKGENHLHYFLKVRWHGEGDVSWIGFLLQKLCCHPACMTLFWNGVLADAIKFRCTHIELSCVLASLSDVILRGPCEDKGTQKYTQGEYHVMPMNTKNYWQPPEAQREPWNRFCLRPWGWINLADTWFHTFSLQDHEEINFSCFKLYSLW